MRWVTGEVPDRGKAQLTALGIQFMRESFHVPGATYAGFISLQPPAKKELVKVTGIHHDGNVLEVTFSWRRVNYPEEIRAFAGVNHVDTAVAVFELHDDRWRLKIVPSDLAR
jgi:hypothetical protein